MYKQQNSQIWEQWTSWCNYPTNNKLYISNLSQFQYSSINSKQAQWIAIIWPVCLLAYIGTTKTYLLSNCLKKHCAYQNVSFCFTFNHTSLSTTYTCTHQSTHTYTHTTHSYTMMLTGTLDLPPTTPPPSLSLSHTHNTLVHNKHAHKHSLSLSLTHTHTHTYTNTHLHQS